MIKEVTKIPLYRIRTFGEKVSVTFDFLRQNWRLWLQLNCYILLPLCLLQALTLNAMASGIIEGGMLSESVGDIMPSELQDGLTYLLSYLCMLFLSFVGAALEASIIFSMMRYDREQPKGLNGATPKDLKPLIFKALRRSIVLLLIMTMLVVLYFVVMIMLSTVSFLFLAIGIILFFVLAIALSHSLPVYLLEEDMTAFGSIGRGFMLGWLTWGGTLLLMIVIGFLAGILQGITTFPWYVCMIIKMIFAFNDEGGSFTSTVFYDFIMYLLAVLQAFGVFLTSSFSFIALAYQYGSAAEQRDHFSVDEDIERFENMVENVDEIANFDKL